MSKARLKAVFFDDAFDVAKLKRCALFWENIVVYERYIQDLVNAKPELTKFTYGLIENGIMKIVQTPEDLKGGLRDKIYAGLDKGLWTYLYENTSEITVQPELPSDLEEILRERSERDYQDKNLKELYDSIVYNLTVKDLMNGVSESKYFPFATAELAEEMVNTAMELAEKQYEHVHSSRPERNRYPFRYQNKMLIEQLSVSSALCVGAEWVPLYRYKLGASAIDAKTYLDGLEDVAVTFVDNSSIQDFSLDEILTLRSNEKWNNAMNRLADLCNKARVQADPAKFKEHLTQEIIGEYQTSLEEERMNKKKLVKTIGKNVAYTGLSLVPIFGAIFSTVTSIADPLLNFLWKRKKQKNLPLFLNDMRALKNMKRK